MCLWLLYNVQGREVGGERDEMAVVMKLTVEGGAGRLAVTVQWLPHL